MAVCTVQAPEVCCCACEECFAHTAVRPAPGSLTSWGAEEEKGAVARCGEQRPLCSLGAGRKAWAPCAGMRCGCMSARKGGLPCSSWSTGGGSLFWDPQQRLAVSVGITRGAFAKEAGLAQWSSRPGLPCTAVGRFLRFQAAWNRWWAKAPCPAGDPGQQSRISPAGLLGWEWIPHSASFCPSPVKREIALEVASPNECSICCGQRAICGLIRKLIVLDGFEVKGCRF